MDAPLLVAASYAQLYLRAVQLPVDRLLADTGLTESDLGSRDYLEYAVLARLFDNIEACGAEPGWAARTGAVLNISTHGPLGFAALSAPTLGTALEVMAELHPVRVSTLQAELYAADGRLHFVMHHLTGEAKYRRYTTEATTRVLQALVETIVGHAAGDNLRVNFRNPEPGYADVLREIYGSPCTFDADYDGISIPASWRHIRSPLYDEASYRANCAKCREIIAGLSHPGDVAHQVRTILASHFDRVRLDPANVSAPPGLAAMAERLNTTPRTLIRKLKAQDTAYRTLLDEARLACAETLLRDSHLPVMEVAARLGYSDPANFGRAFRKLTGMTPAAWRRRPPVP